MTTELPVWNEQEQKAIVYVCILAALADGVQSQLERDGVKRIIENFSGGAFDLNSAYQRALDGQLTLADATRTLSSSNGKALAYEMAVCTCLVDHAITPAEQQFLASLRQALKLEPAATDSFQQSAETLSGDALGQPPVLTSLNQREAELDQIIVNRAILAGALELIPQTLATMAIVPIQMRLVYQVGASYGVKLDAGHVKEFLATVGVGLTSQVVERYVSRFVKKASSRFAGRIISSLLTQATESAFAFATTYALGHTAKAYYSSGRKLDPAQLKDVFGKMLGQGRNLKTQYASQITQRSSQIKPTEILSLVAQN